MRMNVLCHEMTVNDRIKAWFHTRESVLAAKMCKEEKKLQLAEFLVLNFYEFDKEIVEKVKCDDYWMYWSCILACSFGRLLHKAGAE
jgi:hypothetical protein